MIDLGQSPTLIGVLLGAGWFLIHLATQIAMFHLVDLRQRLRAIVALLGASMVGALFTITGLAHTGWLVDATLAALTSLLTMMCLWVLYMPFYFVIAASLSVRTLIMLASSEDGTLTLEQLETCFASAAVLKDRLAMMEAYRNVAARGPVFTVTPKGRTIAAAFSGLKRIWELGAGG